MTSALTGYVWEHDLPKQQARLPQAVPVVSLLDVVHNPGSEYCATNQKGEKADAGYCDGRTAVGVI